MAGTTVPPRSASALAGLLDCPEIGRLIAELESTRWTGRPGYPLRAMVGVALAKSLYSIPTWTRTVALVREHDALREAIGGECPSVYAAYRFAAKLRVYSDLLDACIARVLDRLRAEKPEFGRDLAIDASDMPAYANGQRYVSKGGRASASGSPIPTQAGDTARPSRRARAAASTATRSTPPSAPARTFPSRGRSRRLARTNRPSPPRCSTRRRIVASPPRRPRLTWATTPKRSTLPARPAAPARSSRSSRLPA